jgi:hypothetical protein
MEQQGSGVISPNDLMTKLAQAKKIMNKVDSGNYKTGQIDENILRSSPEDNMKNLPKRPQQRVQQRPQQNINTEYDEPNFDNQLVEDVDPSRMNVSQPYDVDKINKSKLPESIKRAMIEHPIAQPTISITDGLDMKIIQGAKRLMEQDNPKPVNKKQIPVQEQKRSQPTPQMETSNRSSSDLINTLMPIMENMIRKVMDEKLNQLLGAQKTQSINENLVLKVGDSIFKGKITGVQSSK